MASKLELIKALKEQLKDVSCMHTIKRKSLKNINKFSVKKDSRVGLCKVDCRLKHSHINPRLIYKLDKTNVYLMWFNERYKWSWFSLESYHMNPRGRYIFKEIELGEVLSEKEVPVEILFHIGYLTNLKYNRVQLGIYP